jgi:hypothetical protein
MRVGFNPSSGMIYWRDEIRYCPNLFPFFQENSSDRGGSNNLANGIVP